jgi:hypothetical protein
MLSGNSARYGGGGASYSTLNNCTLSANSAQYGGGVSECTLNNCIAYFNTASQQGPNYDSSTLNYCCASPQAVNGLGNISVDPQLSNLSHLSAGSPCRGAGGSAYTVGGTDIDGEAWSDPPSIGCDEYHTGSVIGPLKVAIAPCATNVGAGLSLQLTALIEGRTSSSTWDFGDNSAVTNQPYSQHAWALPGDYVVVLSAYNESQPGGISATVTVHVRTCFPALPGLISWWGGDGNTVDYQGRNLGALHNGATFRVGRSGQAFSFDGLGDFAQATTVGFPTGNSDRTLECWVQIDTLPAAEAFFVGYGAFGTGDQAYALGASQGWLFFSQWGQAIVGPMLETNRWYHVAVSSVGNFATLYLDGRVVAAGMLEIDTPAGTAMYFGRIPGDLGESRRLCGGIDEVAIYDRALSDLEIQMIYAAAKCKRLLLASPQMDPRGLSFSFPTVAGETYVVEYTASLGDAVWRQLQSVLGNGNLQMITDSASAATQRFYRVRLQ